MAIKKSELYSSLWASCDQLRGGMDASQYKDYVLVLLFVKYVSDKYAGQRDALIDVPAGGSFADMLDARGDKEIGDRMNKVIARLGVTALDMLPQGIRADRQAVAETIENNVRRLIIDEQPINPKYYEKMSELLDALIEQRKHEALDYQQYLARIVELAKQVNNPALGSPYPQTLNTGALRALYDNVGQDEGLALKIDAAVRQTKKDEWRGHIVKEREVRNAVRSLLSDPEEVERIFELLKNQRDY